MAIVTLLLATLLTLQGTNQAQEKASVFSLAISTEASVLKSGSVVKLKIVITNMSNKRIFVPISSSGKNAEFLYDIDVRDDHGDEPPRTRYFQDIRGEKRGQAPKEAFILNNHLAELEPGKAAGDEMAFDKLYDLGKPGKYTIQVQREDRNQTVVKSNTITVNVTP